jgi:hypothetical protein
MRALLLGLGVLWLAGCAAGPRPVPQGLGAADRLAFCEAATLAARAVGTFEVDAKGAHDAHLTGTLELTGGNALSLVAEGKFDREAVRVEFESMSGDINRTVTKGSAASAQHNAAQPALNEAVVVGLVRMGLLHNLALLMNDQMVSKAEGGVRDEVQAFDLRDAGPDTSAGLPCRRVDFSLHVGGKTTAEGGLCIDDATGLPLQHRVTVHFAEGDLTATERFTWKVK